MMIKKNFSHPPAVHRTITSTRPFNPNYTKNKMINQGNKVKSAQPGADEKEWNIKIVSRSESMYFLFVDTYRCVDKKSHE